MGNLTRLIHTLASPSMEMSRLTRDGTAEPFSRDQILKHARGQRIIHFPCSADHEQDWQPYPVDPYSAICDTIHAYIHMCVTIHNVGDKPTVILYTTIIAIVVSHIQRIGRQPGKTTLHSGQSRSSWSAEQGNVYNSVYAIPVAYVFKEKLEL